MLSQNDSGWEKELNIVNWNGQGGKFDIREWNPEHDKMSKGITLSEEMCIRDSCSIPENML